MWDIIGFHHSKWSFYHLLYPWTIFWELIFTPHKSLKVHQFFTDFDFTHVLYFIAPAIFFLSRDFFFPAHPSPLLSSENGKLALTFLQLQELEHQTLIFKYMMASVTLFFHPVLRSVGSIYEHHPSYKLEKCSTSLLFIFIYSFLASPC